MPVSLHVGIKQTQKLVMTQSLKQAIELLQLSTIELSERISEELLENPVIEEDGQSLPSLESDDQSLLTGINQNLSGNETGFDTREEERMKFEDTSDSGYANRIDDDHKRDYFENAVAIEERFQNIYCGRHA